MRKKIAGKQRRGLTPEIRHALLYNSAMGDDRVFKNDQERREAWFEFREQIMAVRRNPCTRPYGWWRYEAPEMPWFGESNEQALARLGLLTEEEIIGLKERGRWPVEPCPGPDWDPRDILKE